MYGGGRFVLSDPVGAEYEISDEQMNTLVSHIDNYSMNYSPEAQMNQGICKMRTNDNQSAAFLIFSDKGGVKVELDNAGLEFDVLPVIQNGRTLVPMRAISDCFNVQVDWNNYTRTISLFTN